MNIRSLAIASVMCAVFFALGAEAQENRESESDEVVFNRTRLILLRSPDPDNLAKFYEALGMKIERRMNGGVGFRFEGGGGAMEILTMDKNTNPGRPKTHRSQQSIVPVLEVKNPEEIVRRARAAGSPHIERWSSEAMGRSIDYVADWENNIFGFARAYKNEIDSASAD